MSGVAPGWYPDPILEGYQRYWDGAAWTSQTELSPAAANAQLANAGSAAGPVAGYGAPSQAQAGPKYAGWWRRVAATIVDAVLPLPLTIPAVILLNNSVVVTEGSTGVTTTSTDGTGLTAAIVLYAAGIVFSLWNVCYRQGRTGYSVGKQALGIKLIKEGTSEPLGGWVTFGRQLLHILDEMSFGLGYLWPIWDRKKQTFADKIIGSVVLVQRRND